MDVLVLRIAMTMGMIVSGTVGMYVLMLVEHNLNPASKGVGDAAQCFKAREMVAALQSRDHRLRHPQACGQLLLRDDAAAAQFKQFSRALLRDRTIVDRGGSMSTAAARNLHRGILAKMRSLGQD